MDNAKIREAKEAFADLPWGECGLPDSPEEIRDFIEIMPGRSRKDKVLESIRAVLTRAPVFDDGAIVQMVLSFLKSDVHIQETRDPEAFCQSIAAYLAHERLFTNEIIINRISELLNTHEIFSALTDREAVFERLSSQLANARFFDNKAMSNKLFNLISGDPAFKDAVKESEP